MFKLIKSKYLGYILNTTYHFATQNPQSFPSHSQRKSFFKKLLPLRPCKIYAIPPLWVHILLFSFSLCSTLSVLALSERGKYAATSESVHWIKLLPECSPSHICMVLSIIFFRTLFKHPLTNALFLIILLILIIPFSSVQLLSRVRLCHPMDCSTPGFPVHYQLPELYSNSCPSSQWCHLTTSSSVVPFSSCLQSFPASGSFQISQLFASAQSIWVAKVFEF